MDPDKLQGFLHRDCQASADGLRNRHTGRRVRAIMPVDVLEDPCDLDPTGHSARRLDPPLIEDAAEGWVPCSAGSWLATSTRLHASVSTGRGFSLPAAET
jgi:dTDP-4-amino-4,6-dideoxygalactose transaminase